MTINKTSSLTIRKRKKGFTLTEIAIVLGIIGLILGAIWTAAASVYNNQRTTHANTAILQIAQGIRGLYSTQGSMEAANNGTIITPNLITQGLIPPDLVATGPFPGGATGVVQTTDGLGFQILMTNVPQQACITLLTAVGGATRDPGLFAANAVASAAIAAGDATATGVPSAAVLPVTPAAAVLAIAGAAPNKTGGCTAANNPAKVSFAFTLK